MYKLIYLVITTWGVSVLPTFAIETPDWYPGSCAAKLFVFPVYRDIAEADSNSVQRAIDQRKQMGWEIDALPGIVEEYQKARPFMAFITNSYPKTVEAFIPDNQEDNMAQAIWASLLQNYQDGGKRTVKPIDIRTLLFTGKVVQPVGIESATNMGNYQYVDAKMVEIGSRLFLESARQWNGEYGERHHANPYFDRQSHREFWNALNTYVGIMRHFDPEYSKTYLYDLILCRQDNLCRWIWNTNYFERIRQDYAPGATEDEWPSPARAFPVLIQAHFAEDIPYILKITGTAVIELTEAVLANEVSAYDSGELPDAEIIIIGDICSWIRGTRGNSETSLNQAQSMTPTQEVLRPNPIESISDLDEAWMKWIYFLQLHVRLLSIAGQEDSPWLEELRAKYLPSLEDAMRVVEKPPVSTGSETSNAAAQAQSTSGAETKESRLARVNATIDRLPAVVESNGNRPRFRNLLASAFCSRAYLAESLTDIDESISIYRTLLAEANLSEFDRIDGSLGLARAVLCKAYLAPAEREKMERAADAILQKLTNDERLDPVLRNIAGSFSMQWQTLKDQGRPQEVVDWFGWMEQMRQWESDHSGK